LKEALISLTLFLVVTAIKMKNAVVLTKDKNFEIVKDLAKVKII